MSAQKISIAFLKETETIKILGYTRAMYIYEIVKYIYRIVSKTRYNTFIKINVSYMSTVLKISEKSFYRYRLFFEKTGLLKSRTKTTTEGKILFIKIDFCFLFCLYKIVRFNKTALTIKTLQKNITDYYNSNIQKFNNKNFLSQFIDYSVIDNKQIKNIDNSITIDKNQKFLNYVKKSVNDYRKATLRMENCLNRIKYNQNVINYLQKKPSDSFFEPSDTDESFIDNLIKAIGHLDRFIYTFNNSLKVISVFCNQKTKNAKKVQNSTAENKSKSVIASASTDAASTLSKKAAELEKQKSATGEDGLTCRISEKNNAEPQQLLTTAEPHFDTSEKVPVLSPSIILSEDGEKVPHNATTLVSAVSDNEQHVVSNINNNSKILSVNDYEKMAIEVLEKVLKRLDKKEIKTRILTSYKRDDFMKLSDMENLNVEKYVVIDAVAKYLTTKTVITDYYNEENRLVEIPYDMENSKMIKKAMRLKCNYFFTNSVMYKNFIVSKEAVEKNLWWLDRIIDLKYYDDIIKQLLILFCSTRNVYTKEQEKKWQKENGYKVCGYFEDDIALLEKGNISEEVIINQLFYCMFSYYEYTTLLLNHKKIKKYYKSKQKYNIGNDKISVAIFNTICTESITRMFFDKDGRYYLENK